MCEFPFTDDALHESALLITDAMLEAVTSPAERTHQFTASFEARMKKLILKAKRAKSSSLASQKKPSPSFVTAHAISVC